jgi:hypothetical protein
MITYASEMPLSLIFALLPCRDELDVGLLLWRLQELAAHRAREEADALAAALRAARRRKAPPAEDAPADEEVVKPRDGGGYSGPFGNRHLEHLRADMLLCKSEALLEVEKVNELDAAEAAAAPTAMRRAVSVQVARQKSKRR